MAKKKSAPAEAAPEVALSTYTVLDTLQFDGDLYTPGEQIELDPASLTVAQLQAANVIGAAITIEAPAA